MSSLTGKQKNFVNEYLTDFNATRAAQRAGYGGDDNALAAAASRLLRNVKVANKIRERLANSVMRTDEALSLLGKQARFDPGPFIVIDEKGAGLDLQALKDSGLTGAIKSITPTASGVKVEFESRQGAIDKILRAAGAYQDKVDVTSGGKPIKGYVTFSPDDWEEDGSDDNKPV